MYTYILIEVDRFDRISYPMPTGPFWRIAYRDTRTAKKPYILDPDFPMFKNLAKAQLVVDALNNHKTK